MKYKIIPISFKNYNEYVDSLNEFGENGWIFGAMIKEYLNSPIVGVTTHDYICYKHKNKKAKTKKIKVLKLALVNDLLNLYIKEEITFSRFVELLNEEIIKSGKK